VLPRYSRGRFRPPAGLFQPEKAQVKCISCDSVGDLYQERAPAFPLTADSHLGPIPLTAVPAYVRRSVPGARGRDVLRRVPREHPPVPLHGALTLYVRRTHGVLSAYSPGAHGVLSGYSRRSGYSPGAHGVTFGVLTAYVRGTHLVCSGYSRALHRVTRGVLHGYSVGTHGVLRGCARLHG
jgi:hypothetical protein